MIEHDGKQYIQCDREEATGLIWQGQFYRQRADAKFGTTGFWWDRRTGADALFYPNHDGNNFNFVNNQYTGYAPIYVKDAPKPSPVVVFKDTACAMEDSSVAMCFNPAMKVGQRYHFIAIPVEEKELIQKAREVLGVEA